LGLRWTGLGLGPCPLGSKDRTGLDFQALPAIEDRMKTLIKNQEKALAAHELACSCMADRQKSTFILFRKREKVWLDSRNMKT